MNFIKDEAGFIISVELCLFIALTVVAMVTIASVVNDYLGVWTTTFTDNIQILCATFAPGSEPAACAKYLP